MFATRLIRYGESLMSSQIAVSPRRLAVSSSSALMSCVVICKLLHVSLELHRPDIVPVDLSLSHFWASRRQACRQLPENSMFQIDG